MTAPLRTHADLAEILNLPLSTVIELRKREGWPCVRLGRAVRFTDAQIAEIITSHIEVCEPEPQSSISAFPGQTPGSIRRNK